MLGWKLVYDRISPHYSHGIIICIDRVRRWKRRNGKTIKDTESRDDLGLFRHINLQPYYSRVAKKIVKEGGQQFGKDYVYEYEMEELTMDQKTQDSLRNKMNKVVSELAMKDYLRANTNKQGKLYKKHHPYMLSPDTNEAQEILNLLYKLDVTFEDEVKIKTYMMKRRLLNNGKLYQEV